MGLAPYGEPSFTDRIGALVRLGNDGSSRWICRTSATPGEAASGVMRDIINTPIEFLERFRPFAPSMAVEALDDFFAGAAEDPFMQQVHPVRPEKRSVVPAITHVDGSGWLQTVSARSNPRYYNLITTFGRLTGVPMLLNTRSTKTSRSSKAASRRSIASCARRWMCL
jgi:predicted NodU family carbamoyl transferase